MLSKLGTLIHWPENLIHELTVLINMITKAYKNCQFPALLQGSIIAELKKERKPNTQQHILPKGPKFRKSHIYGDLKTTIFRWEHK